ncbi:conserved hypothetical protein [uncultured Alphaproteobacteria bacterium]|uniref:Mu-like prophage FluMu N-terminal domain-containing protein n=1 Tax=uncultured Alphaproteobacteria bacterium TaxID=91750 RepID=A0A212KBW1_9PROT|nr:conserved hypothetical protein [uncultured Alphaproteobacteria bacterium]
MNMIRVIAKKDGFRRAGRAWVGTTELPERIFTDAELHQLQSEPMLVVQEFEIEDETKGEDAPKPTEPESETKAKPSAKPTAAK